jgi:hypothetical protein
MRPTFQFKKLPAELQLLVRLTSYLEVSARN